MRVSVRPRLYLFVFCIGLITTVTTLYILGSELIGDGIIRLPLNSNTTVCAAPLCKNVAKVASYSFPSVSRYGDLFTGPAYNSDTVPDKPVLVSAFSSNHFEEGLVMIRNICGIVTERHLHFIVYDIGLSSKEPIQITKTCPCEVRRFPFEKYPSFVKALSSYTFKPLAVQMVVREHPFVIWLDSSIRFTTRNLEPLFDKARKHGILCTGAGGSIAQRTHPATFRFLDELPCTFRNAPELQATVLVIHGTQFIRDHFLKPWVSCALSFGCMKPERNSDRLIHCHNYGEVYHDCHRFDQSVAGILLYRLFLDEIDEHLVGTDFFKIDRLK